MKTIMAALVVACLAVSSVQGFVPASAPSTFSHQAAFHKVSSRSAELTKLEIAQSRARLKHLEWKKPSDKQVEELMKKYGEASRFYRRDVFTPGDWVRSRRPSRIYENLRTTLKSGLMHQIMPEITVLGLVSTFVVVYNKYLLAKFAFLPALKLPLVPFNLAAASLGLMLGFRTNVCYSRWNEARTAWGKVINDSRSLARMGCIWGRSYKKCTPAWLMQYGIAICSFSRALMNRTLPSQEDEQAFKLYCMKGIGATNPHYAKLLVDAKHRPTAALAQITSLLVQLDLHPMHQTAVEQCITELCSAMGACERILTSPVPTFYPRHTTRFLAMWLLLLPFGLVDVVGGFLQVPVMILLGGFLLGIEELSNQMEEPFSILPMEKMCQGSIKTPVLEQVERSIEWNQAGYTGYDSSMNANGDVSMELKDAPMQVVDAAVVSNPPPVTAAITGQPPAAQNPPPINGAGPGMAGPVNGATVAKAVVSGALAPTQNYSIPRQVLRVGATGVVGADGGHIDV